MESRTPALVARSVCFAYDGGDVLHDVSLELHGGEIAAIVGANGSGKSTLVEVLAGVRRLRRGAVTWRGDLALVVQRPAAPDTLPLTVHDVVSMGTWAGVRRTNRRAARRAVAESLERVGMADLATRPLSALSGGQRQRIFLAQGIVRRPDILLLDEPIAGLDGDSVQAVRRILAEEVARGVAVACVTHDDADIATADRVIRLDRGVRLS